MIVKVKQIFSMFKNRLDLLPMKFKTKFFESNRIKSIYFDSKDFNFSEFYFSGKFVYFAEYFDILRNSVEKNLLNYGIIRKAIYHIKYGK